MRSEFSRMTSPATAIKRQDLIGVGGWLLLFCIEFATRIGTQLTLSILIWGPWHYFSIFAVSLGALSFLTGFNVWRVTSKALLFTRVLLIIVFGAGLFGVGLEILSARYFLHGTGIDFIIEAVVWFWYFKKSKRVKATFGRSI
jgi:hypothetical protein